MKTIEYISVDKIVPHPDNPRREIGDVTELAESIKACGVLQNLTVVPCPARGEGMYVAIIGHRRLEASKLAGLTEVPCVVSDMTPQEQVATMLLENMARADLTAYEQAQGFQMLMDFGETVNTISQKTGFSKTTVRRRLEMAKLDQTKLQEKCKARQISLFEVDRLSEIEDVDERNRALDAVGTPNADNAYQKAIDAQRRRKRREKWIAVLAKKGIPFVKQDTLGAEWRYPDKYYIDVMAEPTDDLISEYFLDGEEYCAIDNTMYIYLRVKKEQVQQSANDEWKRKSEERVARVKALGEATERARVCRYSWLERNPRAFNSNPEGVCKILYRVLFDKDHLGKKYNGISKEALAALGSTEDNIDHEVPAVAIGRILLAWLDNNNAPYRSWDGEYNESRALNAVYDLLACVGYDPSTEEIELLNGTHEFYGEVNDDET